MVPSSTFKMKLQSVRALIVGLATPKIIYDLTMIIPENFSHTHPPFYFDPKLNINIPTIMRTDLSISNTPS